MLVATRQCSRLGGESDAVCGPVLVPPVGLLWLEPVLLLIVPAMTPAPITLAGRLVAWKPLQQLPSVGSSRP
jgi:hypothetical protein